MKRLAILALLLFTGIGVAYADSAPHGHVAKSLALPGDGGWDYLSVDAGRLYVAHNLVVQVIDLATDSLIGAVTGVNGAHGVAIAPDLGRGFAASGRDSAIIVFDTKTLATLQRISLPARFPDAMCYEPKTHIVFSFNGGSANTAAIDAASGKLLGTIDLGGKPEFAVADGSGLVYVNNEDSSYVAVVDAAKLTVRSRWPIAPGQTPSGLALDPVRHRLFSVCENKLVIVLDATNGKVLQSLPIGEGCDGVAFDTGARRAYATNGEGTITVLREDKPGHYEVAETVPTRVGARTVAVDPKSHRVFTATPKFGPKPEPTADRPHPRTPILPGTFEVLVVEP